MLLELRHRWRDGTTHLVFDPLELLERLAGLTPRPRINLVLYEGVLAAHAAWRSRLEAAVRGSGASPVPADPATGGVDREASPATPSVRHRSDLLWAQVLARSFGYDVLACARWGGRLIALIEQASVVARILTHLSLRTDSRSAITPGTASSARSRAPLGGRRPSGAIAPTHPIDLRDTDVAKGEMCPQRA